MSPNARDLRNAGMYIFVLAALAGGMVLGGGVAERGAARSFTQTIPSIVDAERERTPTRLSLVVANAREIRAALTKPIPRPEPLPPITAKLAYGHLKPGGPGAMAIAQRAMAQRKPKAGMDAMAMDVSFRASSAVIPELHKVY